MNNLLHTYLEREWRFNNHAKYQHYFEEWFSNLTDNQIHYFTKDMNKAIK